MPSPISPHIEATQNEDHHVDSVEHVSDANRFDGESITKENESNGGVSSSDNVQDGVANAEESVASMPTTGDPEDSLDSAASMPTSRGPDGSLTEKEEIANILAFMQTLEPQRRVLTIQEATSPETMACDISEDRKLTPAEWEQVHGRSPYLTPPATPGRSNPPPPPSKPANPYLARNGSSRKIIVQGNPYAKKPSLPLASKLRIATNRHIAYLNKKLKPRNLVPNVPITFVSTNEDFAKLSDKTENVEVNLFPRNHVLTSQHNHGAVRSDNAHEFDDDELESELCDIDLSANNN